MKKLTALLLCLIMIFGLGTLTATAAEADDIKLIKNKTDYADYFFEGLCVDYVRTFVCNFFVNEEDELFNKDTMISNAKVFTGTVRSGQRLEYEGSIILLGDINAGSEVVAEQNIVVLGDIRGYVHAGAKGNRGAFIAANSINPTQLRISDLTLKNESKIDIGNGFEMAKVSMGIINIEK